MKTGKKVRCRYGWMYSLKKQLNSIISCMMNGKQEFLTSVSVFLFLFLQGKKGEIRPPKLKTEDPNKSYVQRPVKRG